MRKLFVVPALLLSLMFFATQATPASANEICGYGAVGTITADQDYVGGVAVGFSLPAGAIYYDLFSGQFVTASGGLIGSVFISVPSFSLVNSGTVFNVATFIGLVQSDTVPTVQAVGYLNTTPPFNTQVIPTATLSIVSTCVELSDYDNRNTNSPDTAIFNVVSPDGATFNIWNPSRDPYRPALVITPEIVNAVPLNPVANTQIAASADGYYRFFRLTTGELQLNVGPDFEGKVFVTIFSENGAQVVRRYTIEADGSVR